MCCPVWDGIPVTTFPHGHSASPPSSVRTPRGGLRAGSSRMPRTARHVSSATSGSQFPCPTISPRYTDRPAILGFSKIPRMLVRFHRVVPRRSCCGGASSSLVHSRMIPLMLPAAQQRRARLGYGGAFHRVHGHVVVAVPERARAAQEPPPVDRRLLVRQLLPLGLALLLGLGHRDQDPGGQPARVGAQVDGPVDLGEPHPGLVEPGNQVLQVQRFADEPGPT